MPTRLAISRHLDGLREATRAFVASAELAGLDAPVPTCPEWTVLDLVAHQGMVHRWATALVRGGRPSQDEVSAYAAQGRAAPDPPAWLATGAGDLLAALAAAPEDLRTLVFLHDAPAPRAFWARRQCHETTIHAVDALAAVLGRPPRPEEVDLDRELAGDGIDELLAGFLTRPPYRLRCEEEALLTVRPEDLPDWWEVSLGPRPARVARWSTTAAPPDAPDWELTGSAVDLYLRLWNRTPPPIGGGEWQRLTAVSWT